jgi:hypothetical protein
MRLFDAIDSPKQLYLIIEFVPGKILHNIIKSQVKKNLPEI